MAHFSGHIIPPIAVANQWMGSSGHNSDGDKLAFRQAQGERVGTSFSGVWHWPNPAEKPRLRVELAIAEATERRLTRGDSARGRRTGSAMADCPVMDARKPGAVGKGLAGHPADHQAAGVRNTLEQ